jgi:hypothetical protein
VNGEAATAPLTSVMNSRRLMGFAFKAEDDKLSHNFADGLVALQQIGRFDFR